MKKLLLILLILKGSLASAAAGAGAGAGTNVGAGKVTNETTDVAYQEYLKRRPTREQIENKIKEQEGLYIPGLLEQISSYLTPPVSYVQWKSNNEKLINAAHAGNLEVVKKLLDSGNVNVNAKDKNGDTALMAVVMLPGKKIAVIESIIKVLVEHGANINEQNVTGETALIIAAMLNRKESVNALLKYKPDLNIRTKEGETALTIALKDENMKIAQALKKAIG